MVVANSYHHILLFGEDFISLQFKMEYMLCGHQQMYFEIIRRFGVSFLSVLGQVH